ncbi:hypothetical protein B0H17DRAFT_1028487 [Mycena rosella]|uniref:DUF3835 domain-containing protein n=1 Tax=Mycena rosella TaxID=1033263 RepID=A0AAD7H1B2_MYCRO|nr:hypothetical protein B0H17DRAFT_1028487 [Mycena rosella]
MAGKAQNLNDGSAQALQALLNSLTPDAPVEGGGKLSAAAVKKLSEKLKELVGDDVGAPQNRNEEGQLLNEEGLPIIDITEPTQVADVPPLSLVPDEDIPIPISALPPSEQQLRRRERDRILDLLEEEEQAEQAKGEELSQEQRQEILRKRKKAAQDELNRLKAAKDMQKKMGKALLRGMSTAREQTAPVEAPAPDPAPGVEDIRPVPRKTVKFADAAGEVETPEADETPDWGDVVPARLRPNSSRSLISNALIDTHPMKMQVVERIPGKPKLDEPQPDSDDESEPPDSPTEVDSDEGGEFMSDEELAEEVDLDFAQHQREITLEYHEKRAKMAETTSNAMKSHSHDQDGVSQKTAEESLNQSSRKPAISHFQANRLTSSYNAAAPSSSKSLGANVLPASSARTLQRAIRVGKLDSDNRLVGGDAEESGSEQEDDTGMQEIMELLKKGEVYNLGPDGKFIHTIPPPSQPPSSPSVPSPAVAPDTPPPPISSRKPPTSKFKLARAGQRPAATSPSPDMSGPPTPPSSAARSSPKLPTDDQSIPPTSPRAPVLSSAVVEKPPSSSSAAFASMIIDSPSFPESRRPQQPPTVRAAAAADKPAKVSRFLAERMH